MSAGLSMSKRLPVLLITFIVRIAFLYRGHAWNFIRLMRLASLTRLTLSHLSL